MKYILTLAVFTFILWSCKEEGPYINCCKDQVEVPAIDTTYITTNIDSAQKKNVLIEDLTGVKCPNCPDAASILANLIASNPGRIIGMSVHPKLRPFSDMLPGSKYNFVGAADSVLGLMWNVQSLPIGTIDRVKFSGETYILVERSKWYTYANQRLAVKTPVNITISAKKDSVTKKWNIYSKIYFNEAYTGSVYLSMALIEDGIIDLQDSAGVVLPFYHHNHVLRKMLTPFQPYWGAFLMNNPEKQRVFEKEYRTTFDPVWKPENMKVIVYVSKYDGTNYDILQVQEIELLK